MPLRLVKMCRSPTDWLAEHDAPKGERDALAEELREVYSNAVDNRLSASSPNNEALSALHQARPAGVMEHLLSAELHARGLGSFRC
jgi:hypothetical protein